MASLENTVGFRDVKDEIMRRIRARVWPQGALIPGEIELAEEFGCARATVNRALRELADAGIVDRKRRAGTRVATAPARHARFEIPIIRQEIEASGASYRYRLVSRREIAAPDWLQAQLDLPEDARLLHLKCMHYADNFPYQFEERWINVAVVPEVRDADLTAIGPNEWLVNEVPFTEGKISFMAAPADAELAGFLSVAPGEAVFVTERVTWLSQDPVTLARMYYRPGYRMVTRL